MDRLTPQNYINFGAKYTGRTTVKRLNKITNEYVTQGVSVLEFDPNNKKDLDAMVKLAEKWKGSRFGDNIASTANKLYFDKRNPGKERIFMLTTQNLNFSVPDIKQVLGLTQTSCDDGFSICVDYLQTKPTLMNNPNKSKRTKEYTHVGEGLLNAMKSKFSDKPIYLYPLDDVTGFYIKNGFSEVSKDPLKYKWVKE